MTRKGKPQRGAMCGQKIESRYLCIILHWRIEVKETKANVLTLVWLPLSSFYCCLLGQKATQRSVTQKKLSKRGWAKNKDIFSCSRANNTAGFSAGFFFLPNAVFKWPALRVDEKSKSHLENLPFTSQFTRVEHAMDTIISHTNMRLCAIPVCRALPHFFHNAKPRQAHRGNSNTGSRNHEIHIINKSMHTSTDISQAQRGMAVEGPSEEAN